MSGHGERQGPGPPGGDSDKQTVGRGYRKPAATGFAVLRQSVKASSWAAALSPGHDTQLASAEGQPAGM